MLKVNQQLALAVDLGGTKIIAAVVLPDGKIISRNYCLTVADKGPKAVFNRLLSAANKTVTQAKLKTSELTGVGIAAAGALDMERGVITDSPNLPNWHDIPLRDILADGLGITTYLINDASAAALGEHRFGAGKGVDNLIYLTVSTGIGGGIIMGSKLYSGADGCAGELGHMTIEAGGPKCNCGNLGCLEALASGTAVAREAVRRVNGGETSSIVELVAGRLESITAEIVALAARQGDSLACDIVAEAANYLGIGLANLVNIFNPELIVIGGGMSQMGNMLLKPARKVVKERAFKLPARTVRIVRARLGSNAGIIGAAAYVFDQQLERKTKA
ncbi:MAG TPA: ROK family protein [Dehalococcoidia bacterium]|nr:ROK family protein [Dehalococcoidia bacterium]